jgi:ParB family chromosome partitioning protein
MLNANAISQSIPIGQLRESPSNPRRTFNEEALRELADSIRALGGLLQPIIVRPLDVDTYEVVAGARRFRAARLAGLDALDARVVELTDEQAIEVQLIENAQRSDVHPYEEAAAYRALLALPQYDVASIASKVGKSLSYVHGWLRLAELIPEVAEVFLADKITAGHAVMIARLPQEQQKDALDAAFREDRMTREKQAIPVRELSQWIRENLMLILRDAVFDLESVELAPEAGSCSACHMRTGANAALFEDFAHDDRGLSPRCYMTKVENHIAFQRRNDAGMIQITRAHYTHSKATEPILTRKRIHHHRRD